MGMISEILSGLGNAHTTYNPGTAFQESPETSHRRAVLERVETQKSNLLNNDSQLDAHVSSAVEAVSPVLAKPKYNKFGAKTDAVDAVIPSDHPFAGSASEIKSTYQDMLSDPKYTGVDANTLLHHARTQVMAPKVTAAYDYQMKQDASMGNYFGLFGGNKAGTKPLPGYEEYKKKVTAERTKTDNEGMMDVGLKGGATMAVLDAGLSIAGGLLAGTLGVAALPEIAAGAALAGLVAIPLTMLGHEAKVAAENSDWAIANPDSKIPAVVAGTAGVLVGGSLGKGLASAVEKGVISRIAGESAEKIAEVTAKAGASKLVKGATTVSVLGGATAGGVIGVDDPSNMLDLGAFVAGESLLRKLGTIGKKLGTIGLAKALDKGMISEESQRLFSIHPGAEETIKTWKADKALAEERKLIMEGNTQAAQFKAAQSAEYTKHFEDSSKVADDVRAARPQYEAGLAEQYQAGKGLTSERGTRTAVLGKGKKKTTVDLGNNEDDLIIRGLTEKGFIDDMESTSALNSSKLEPAVFDDLMNSTTESRQGRSLDAELNLRVQAQEIKERITKYDELLSMMKEGLVDTGAAQREILGGGDSLGKERASGRKANKENADEARRQEELLGKHAGQYDFFNSGMARGVAVTGAGLAAGAAALSADNADASVAGSLAKASEPFFSKVASLIGDKLTGGTTKENLVKMLNGKASQDEIKIITEGLPEGKLSKADVLDHVKANDTQFVDHVFGGQYKGRDNLAIERFGKRYIDLPPAGQDVIKNFEQKQEYTTTKYADYESLNTPGAVPGSHRELFVTAPGKYNSDDFYSVEKAYNKAKDYVLMAEEQYGKDSRYYKEALRAEEIAKENFKDNYQPWKDGHDDYDSVENPIVRLRMHDRELEGKKILHIDEMQGPQDAEQMNMPEHLRSRIYDIGTKRTLAYAKEGGYDGISWTMGAQQADRYSLSKQVTNIEAVKDPLNKQAIGSKQITINLKDDYPIVLQTDGTGVIVGGPKPYLDKQLSYVIGKEHSKTVLSSESVSIKGKGLKVGGEGLKDLYDQQLPSKFGKYGKENVGSADLGNADPNSWNDKSLTAHFIPVTANTPSTFGKFAVAGATGIGAIKYATQPLPNESPESHAERNTGAEAGNSIMDAVWSSLTNNPLTDLLTPSSANAASSATIAKAGLTVPRVLTDFFGKGIDALRAAVDGGYVRKPLANDAITVRGTEPTGDFNLAPSGSKEIRQVYEDGMTLPGMNLMTPMGKNNLLAKTIEVGEEMFRKLKGFAPVELAYRLTEAKNATEAGMKALANAERVFEIDMGKNSLTKDVMNKMQPIQDSTRHIFDKQQTFEALYHDALETDRKLLKAGKLETDPEVVDNREVIANALKEVEAGKPFVAQAEQDIMTAYKEMASMSPRAKYALAAEDTANFDRFPFLRGTLAPNEVAYVNAVKDHMHYTAEKIVAAKGEVITSSEYMKHSYQKTDALEARRQELQKLLEDYNVPNTEMVLANSKFFQRTKYSYNYVPDIKYNLAEYIPDAERRIAVMNFWKPGQEGGWDAVRKSSYVMNSKKLTAMFDSLDTALRPAENTFSNKLANAYTSMEVVRLLGGSLSAPFKHLLKLQADVATYGVFNTLSLSKEALGIGSRNFVRNQVGKLVDAGFMDAKFGENLWAKTKETDAWVQSMTSQSNMTNYLSEMDRISGSPYKGAAEKFVDSITDLAGFGIKAVESFDRTVTVLASAKMAAKKGMTAQQAVYGTYETMLLNNFMGGALNAAWAKDPKVRAAMLFQGTPFKIWERRLVAAANGGKDLVTTWGKIKNGDIPLELESLYRIEKDMKEGTTKFKQGILFDSLLASKNAFGNSSTGILVKELMGIGAIMAGGSHIFNVNMAPQFLHLPFVKTEGGTAELSTSPLIQAGVKTATGGKPSNVDASEWDEENKPFFLSTFYNHWLGSSGYSLFASKMGRIGSNDIPEMYGSSVGKYLFAIKNAD